MASPDRHEELFEQSLGAILTVDRGGYIVGANDAAGQLLREGARSLRATPLLKHFHADDRDAGRKLLLAALRGDRADGRLRLEGPGPARSFSVRMVAGAPPSPAGEVLVFLLPVQDEVSDAQQASQLSDVLQRLPGQAVLALDGAGAVRRAHGAAGVLWRPDEDLEGTKLSALLDPASSPPAVSDSVLRELREGRDWSGILWFRRGDGSQLAMQVYGAPTRVPETGEVRGAILVARDRNDEQELRRKLTRAERLASVGELVASIARELREPLDQLELFAGARCANGGGTGDREAWQHVRSQARQLLGLVDGLSAFASEVQLERTPVAIGALIEEAVAAQAALIRETGVQVLRHVPKGLPEIPLDRAQIRQVLEQLLVNAGEALAGRDGGAVRIDATEQPRALLVRVHDNGPGVPAEQLERIFDPFFTTRRGRSGLGLAIARGIVAAHGGRLWADLPAEGGTAMLLEVPVHPEESKKSFRPVPLVAARSGRVLVIDDDQGLRTTLRKFLLKVGYEVEEAWSGRSALAKITSARVPDMVVTDLKMKDGTGYWLLEELRRDFPVLLKRTVIMTGDPSRAATENLSQEMGCPVLNKPFDFRQLMEAMDEVAVR